MRKELLPHVRGVRSEVVRTGLLGAGNKGAVALRLSLQGESFCFVNVSSIPNPNRNPDLVPSQTPTPNP